MTKKINILLPSLFPAHCQWKMNLLQQWDSIVGSLSQTITLEKIEDSCLTIGVYDSSWLHELYLLSGVLLDSINKQLNGHHIERLKFKITYKKPRISKHSHTKYSQPSVKAVTLTKREEASLLKINDDTLRAALKNYLARCRE